MKLLPILLLLPVTMFGAIARTQAVSANANNVAISSTSNGDLIIVWAFNDTNTTVPTQAAGYTTIRSAGSTSVAGRLAYKNSTGGDTSSGTWTNATWVVCMVYSGTASGASAIGANVVLQGGTGTTLTYPSTGTLQDTSGSSWVIGVGGGAAMTAGMNGNTVVLGNRTNLTRVNGLDTGTGVTTFSAQTLNVTTSGRWQTGTVEIKVAAVTNTSNFFEFFR